MLICRTYFAICHNPFHILFTSYFIKHLQMAGKDILSVISSEMSGSVKDGFKAIGT